MCLRKLLVTFLISENDHLKVFNIKCFRYSYHLHLYADNFISGKKMLFSGTDN